MAELEPLDADIRELLDRAKPIDELDAGRRAAILGAVGARLGGIPPAGGQGGSPASPAGTGGGLLATSGARAAAFVATFALGIAAGVAVDRAVLLNTAPAPTAATVAGVTATSVVPSASIAERTVSVPVSALPSAPDAPRPPNAPAAPPVDLARPAAAAEAPSARGLAAERALLDVARSALARGEASDALAAVARHKHDYPAGALTEEREAIAIRALVALGRRDEARARAAEFDRAFPNSLNAHAVKSALGQPVE